MPPPKPSARRRKTAKPAPAERHEHLFDMRFSPPVMTLFLQIQDRRVQAQSKPDQDLYHYTNAAGLLGIIEKNKIWATHISYLNYASELVYARRLVEDALRRHAAKYQSGIVEQFVDRAFRTFDVSQTMDVFIACFCEKGDLLSQWRGYAQSGEGYSIGIDGEKFGAIAAGKIFFGPVMYGREKQEEVIDTILTMLLQGLEKMTADLDNKKAVPLMQECVRVFRRCVWFPLVTFKDEMFEAEHEWRAIHIMEREQTPGRIQFRASGSKLVPYVELDFSQFEKGARIPIRRVYHGPTLNPELSRRVLELLLAKHGYAAEVDGSKIPLRL